MRVAVPRSRVEGRGRNHEKRREGLALREELSGAEVRKR